MSKTLEADKKAVLDMTKSVNFQVLAAYDFGDVVEFEDTAGIANRNYATSMNRFRNALNALWKENKCKKVRYGSKNGNGYYYDFSGQ